MGQVETWRTGQRSRAARVQTPKQRLRLRMAVSLAVLDVVGILIAFVAVNGMAIHGGFYDGGAALQIAILSPTFVVVALFNRAYSPLLIHDAWASIGRALRSMLIASAATVLIAFFLKLGVSWSRITFVLCVGISGMLVMALRYIFGRHASFLIGGEPYEVLYLYDGVPQDSVDPAAIPVTALSTGDFDPSSLSPASYDRFAKAIEHADKVVVHCSDDRRRYWAQALKGADVQGEVIIPEFADLAPLGCGFHHGTPTLVVSRGALGIKDRMLKRGFDLAVAGTALILLGPLMLATALVIRWQDGGPVFFSQTRVGRSNRLFRILKFRSMHVSTADEAGDRSTSRSDERITAFGRFIRATSIDELPQLLNVIKGDMSIVGPRPHALGSTADDLLFWHIDARYWHRHVIRPGLTGLAQVRGYRGPTRCKEDLLNRLRSDLEYLRGWTIWRDAAILLRTVSVLLHDNAY